VFTLGKSGKPENLLTSQDRLQEEGIGYYPTTRGGDITYHGPGQLVAYPIIDLENYFTDIHKYLRELEQAVIDTLADFGITAGRIEGLTGVWVGQRKICAMGVRASRWVVMHGIALNVAPDLAYFGYIIPCNIRDKGVTSLELELGQKSISSPGMQAVENVLLTRLAERFGFHYQAAGIATS
jgi:lipoyl(octanoyl) transferase